MINEAGEQEEINFLPQYIETKKHEPLRSTTAEKKKKYHI